MKKALLSRKEILGMNSGMSVVLFQQAQALRDLGYDVYAIAETIENYPLYTSVKTFRWPFSGYFRRRFYARQVAKWIKRNRPEIVIGNGDIFHQDIMCMGNCVHLAHELIWGGPLPAYEQTGRLHKAIFTGGSFSMLVCLSEMVQRDFARRFSVPKEKSCVIYPSVDLSRFSLKNSSEASAEYRAKIGFSKGDLILGLITSGDFKKRNVELLVRTLTALKPEFPKLKALVIGKDRKEAYVKLAEDLGVGADIVFAPPTKDVQYYYNMIDVFVLPAYIEEFGIVALEAMASAKPVVLGKNVGAAEILEDYSREYIMKKLNVAEFVSKLRPLLISAELRQSLGEANRRTAAKYPDEKMRSAYRDLVKKVLKSKSQFPQ